MQTASLTRRHGDSSFYNQDYGLAFPFVPALFGEWGFGKTILFCPYTSGRLTPSLMRWGFSFARNLPEEKTKIALTITVERVYLVEHTGFELI